MARDRGDIWPSEAGGEGIGCGVIGPPPIDTHGPGPRGMRSGPPPGTEDAPIPLVPVIVPPDEYGWG